MKSQARFNPFITRAVAAAMLAAVLAGCAAPRYRAPVEDRGAAAVKSLPGAENAGKPGYYTVKPGDTLIRVGLETGQNWRDVARWNNLDNPNVLEVGQVLRVVAPGVDAAVTMARPVPSTKVEARPLDIGNAPVAAPPASGAASSAVTPSAASASDEGVVWGWPAAGGVATAFDDVRSKGLVFVGKAGDAVLAAADGRVVYAGSGLRGYGNLVIVKHNNTYITAYAHNKTLLVKEDQVVSRGQKIAEMGSSDAERVQLHFEIRKLGRPIDPMLLLPAR
jgi:lipoprotein NlpD